MPLLISPARTKQQLCVDFAALKHACPKGVYVAPLPDQPLRWSGVMFVRKGQYANAVLRFLVDFPPDYPQRPPIVTFLGDIFHPLVTPLTTYTYTSRDSRAETVSSSDRDLLPPGGLNLSHGFPEWFAGTRADVSDDTEDTTVQPAPYIQHTSTAAGAGSAALTVEVLQYMRLVFDTEAILDSIPQEAAANTGAWHAWRSYRARAGGGRAGSPLPTRPGSASGRGTDRSKSPRLQPGGARRPADWNWQGVWEDRVRKSCQASNADHMLYAADPGDVISFSKLDPQAVDEMLAAELAILT